MIRLQNLTLQRGPQRLLEGAELTLHAGQKVGLIGANGAGKSSLFALLRGELTPDAELIDPLDGLGWLQAIERAALTPPPPRPAYQPPRWADHFRIVADTLALKRDGGLAGDRQGL